MASVAGRKVPAATLPARMLFSRSRATLPRRRRNLGTAISSPSRIQAIPLSAIPKSARRAPKSVGLADEVSPSRSMPVMARIDPAASAMVAGRHRDADPQRDQPEPGIREPECEARVEAHEAEVPGEGPLSARGPAGTRQATSRWRGPGGATAATRASRRETAAWHGWTWPSVTAIPPRRGTETIRTVLNGRWDVDDEARLGCQCRR